MERWSNFVRGLTLEPLRSEMEGHLRSGCEPCGRTLVLLQYVGEAARAEVEVPEQVLSSAMAIFLPRPKEADISVWSRIAAALVFDSWETAIAGVRSAQGGARRLAFSAGEMTVEFLIDSGAVKHSLSIAGQVTAKDGVPMGSVPIALALSESVLTRTLSNDSGEFFIEYPRVRGLSLRIFDEASSREIEIPVAAVFDGDPAEGQRS